MSPPAALSPNAVRSLVEQHRRFLRFVQRRVGSRHEAEDILHDAFATVLARGGSLREEESVTAWFYRILRTPSPHTTAAAPHGAERSDAFPPRE